MCVRAWHCSCRPQLQTLNFLIISSRKWSVQPYSRVVYSALQIRSQYRGRASIRRFDTGACSRHESLVARRRSCEQGRFHARVNFHSGSWALAPRPDSAACGRTIYTELHFTASVGEHFLHPTRQIGGFAARVMLSVFALRKKNLYLILEVFALIK